MATLDYLLLCNAATWRDGLLSVLEAGVERFSADEFPFTVTPTAVFRVTFDDGASEPVTAELLVQRDEDRETLAKQTFTIQPQPSWYPGLPFHFTVLQTVPLDLRRPGTHTFSVALGAQRRQTQFSVVLNG